MCSQPDGSCTTHQLTPGPSTNADGIDLNAAQFLAFYHLPNGAIIGNGDVAEYRFAGQQVVNENFVTTRLDHKFSDKDSMAGTYVFDRTPYTSPDGVNAVLLGSKSSRQVAALEETHLFKPSFANSVRFGYNYEVVGQQPRPRRDCARSCRYIAGNFSRAHRTSSTDQQGYTFSWRRRGRTGLFLSLEHLSGL